MDPICHTLVGAALGHTGLENRTRFARITLIVAVNLPDIDVFAHAMGDTAAYAFRRGVTHGIPALIILPILLAAVAWLLGRERPTNSNGPPLSFRGLLLVSVVGVVSHPILDWMNTYGMRWFMPFVDRWYYGDTLFIIDWIMWLTLLLGLLAAWRFKNAAKRWYSRPATLALVATTAYIGMNYAITQTAERAARQAFAANPPQRVLASPVPFNPLRRYVVLEYEDKYRLGDYWAFTEYGFVAQSRTLEKGDPRHLADARGTVDGRRFLHWARFPYAVTREENGIEHVTIADARYVPDIDNPRLDGFAMLKLAPGDRD